jgi:hypothetical protein
MTLIVFLIKFLMILIFKSLIKSRENDSMIRIGY